MQFFKDWIKIHSPCKKINLPVASKIMYFYLPTPVYVVLFKPEMSFFKYIISSYAWKVEFHTFPPSPFYFFKLPTTSKDITSVPVYFIVAM